MDEALNQSTTDMFRTFAGFEYAPKAAGFHDGDGPAEPDWRAFAESASGAFDNPPGANFNAAVGYILHDTVRDLDD